MSEWVRFNAPPPQPIFGDESFQSIICTGTDKETRTKHGEKTQNNRTQSKWPQWKANTLERTKIGQRTDRAMFSSFTTSGDSGHAVNGPGLFLWCSDRAGTRPMARTFAMNLSWFFATVQRRQWPSGLSVWLHSVIHSYMYPISIDLLNRIDSIPSCVKPISLAIPPRSSRLRLCCKTQMISSFHLCSYLVTAFIHYFPTSKLLILSSTTLKLALICLTAVINCTNSHLSVDVFFLTAIDMFCSVGHICYLIWYDLLSFFST